MILAGRFPLGQSNKRIGKDGKPRYTAVYEDARGVRRSAGTFSIKADSDDAWQDAEAKVREGRGPVLVRGQQKFEPYVRETWFPNHRLELRAVENYTYYLEKHIIPWFRAMAMAEIFPSTVREFVTKLQNDEVTPSSIGYCLTILRAIFTTALTDQVVFFHPCAGVSAPTVAKKIRQIITPEQFDLLYAKLTEEEWQLLVETDIESGIRWGELTELRPKDFTIPARKVTVSRVVVELPRKFHPTGGRFLVKEYPKDKEHREVSLSAPLITKIQAFITKRGLGDDDLIFAMPPQENAPRLRVVLDREKLGWTRPNTAGKKYRHGSKSGYSAGKCRCEHCKASYAIYRAERRGSGKDQPRGRRVVDTGGHISRRWFRDNVWLPARDAAKLGDGVKVHSLRHAHASWLLAGGADLATVKERLGHSSILTTQGYIHTLPDDEEDAALGAFDKIRNRKKPTQNAAGRTAGRGA
jgi:site-specific recombinase XerD